MLELLVTDLMVKKSFLLDTDGSHSVVKVKPNGAVGDRQLSLTEAHDVSLKLERLGARAADCGERSWRKLSILSTAFMCACVTIPVVIFHMAFTLICFIFICFFSIFFCSRR